jgi:hypothetical protein
MSNFVISGGDAGMPAAPRARLIFGLDATASRQPTWDTAVEVQAKMFEAAAPIGMLSVQLIFYRGNKYGYTGWVGSGAELARTMRKISCIGGYTQISRLLNHVVEETKKSPVDQVIFIGDAVEDLNDPPDALAGVAFELGRLKCPVNTFLEGNNPKAEAAFRMISLRSGGRFHKFGVNTPAQVAQLSAKLADVARLAVSTAALLTHKR